MQNRSFEYVVFEILTSVLLKIEVLWDITPYVQLNTYKK
jgi:hypothetical protein